MNKIVEIKNLNFSYDNHLIFESLDLDILANEITYIMGNNGCGKTTLLNIINGFLIPASGTIRIVDNDLRSINSKELSRIISYVPQLSKVDIDFKVKDYLVLGRTPYIKFGFNPSISDYEIVEKYAKLTGVIDFIDSSLNQLSGGEKQLVCITRALIQETPIIVLDEPMSALDLGKQAELLCILQMLKNEYHKTIILTSHNPNHALQYECNVCLINEGKILGYGKNTDILNENNISLVYGNKIKFDRISENVLFSLK